MNLKDKKLAILHQLSQEIEPIDLQSLIEKLGNDFAERSVRRWLTEMVAEGMVEKIGLKKGTRYQVKHKADRKASDTSSFFGFKSKQILQQVRTPIYERRPVVYSDNWFTNYQPNQTYYMPKELLAQLYQAGNRSKKEDPAGTYAHQIFNRLLIDLSYNSSRLEGNTYSLIDTQRLVLEGASAEGKLDEEKIMILNHKEAIRYMVDNASRLEVTEQTICTLHYLLSEGLVDARYAGKIRDYGVRIGGSTYVPFEDKRQLQTRLEAIIAKAAVIENPYEQSLFLLIHISYLQAFSDVNKRTARLCANIPLIKSNLVPLSFNDVERNDYASSMIAIYELQEIQPLLELYAFSYMRTCAIYDSTVKTIGFDEIRVRYRQQRRGVLREIISQQLTGKVMTDYISSEAIHLVKEADRSSFYEDVLEDLKEMNLNRIVGLGITPEQLKEWQEKNDH
jgi:Fic family protein